MRILLTGGMGFAGSHCLRHLLANTDALIILPVSLDHEGRMQRLESARKGFPDDRMLIIPCDLSRPMDTHTRNLIGQVDYIISYASGSDVDQSIKDPVPFIQNNVNVALTVLEFARTQDHLKLCLMLGTDEVHGPALPGQFHAEWDAIIPSNPYAGSKAAQEAIAIAYWRTYGVPVVLTNTMNLVGELQADTKYVPMVIKKIRAGESVPVHCGPDGKPGSRCWIHCRNLAGAVLWIMSNPVTLYKGQLQGVIQQPDRWNIVGEEMDNLTMALRIADLLNLPLTYHLVDFHSTRSGHDSRYALNGDKIRKAGWKAPVSLDEGLANIAEWEQIND